MTCLLRKQGRVLLERLLSAHHVVHHPVMKPVHATGNAKKRRKQHAGNRIPKGVLCADTGHELTLS